MNVLITGANGGLGTAVCQAFLATGATVMGVARAWKEPAPFLTISADVSTGEGCAEMAKRALEHGPLDALVHLVGGFAGGSPVSETSDQVWDGMMNVNLRTAFCEASGETANVVLPSIIDTPRNRATMPQAGVSRWVAPSSIAQVIVWLTTDAATDISGAVIPIYGRA